MNEENRVEQIAQGANSVELSGVEQLSEAELEAVAGGKGNSLEISANVTGGQFGGEVKYIHTF